MAIQVKTKLGNERVMPLKRPFTIGTFDGAAQCAPGEWRA